VEQIQIVYGNHGTATHLEDLLAILHAGFSQLGYPVAFAKRPGPDCTNLLIENFGDYFTAEVERLRGRARFMLLATEFVTGDAFNDFGGPSHGYLRSQIRAKLEKRRRRRRRRRGEDEGERSSAGNLYSKRFKWRRRYDNFLRVSRVADAIWCLSEHQVEAYRRVTALERVFHFDFGYLDPEIPVSHLPDDEKDIDFLFTGTRTPYRDAVLEALRQRGYQIAWLDASTPGFIRRDFVARARICLNLKQFAGWEYPSVARFHYHLVNRSLLLTEQTRFRCELTDLVPSAESPRFVDFCQEVHARGGYNAWATALQEKYRAGTSMLQNLSHLLDASSPGG
jgi:hypothetical protein